ncbi:MAG TPA: ABC transporter permease [Trebonia sp.]|jgi:ABC-2 type transport system permease protein/oleandomycin transport system permease protein
MTTMTAPAAARPAAPLPPRVGPLQAVQQTCSLAWRTLVQIKHNPFELMDFSVQPIMFLLLFVYVFGGAISGSSHEYLQYVLPGIIVQNSLFTTMNTAVGLSTDLDKGFSSRLRALPIARFAPLAGRILADIVKQTWSVALLLAVGLVMGFRPEANALAVLAAAGLVLLFTLAFAWALVWIGMLAAHPEKVQIFGFVVLFPLTFTSGAFVRTASMPGWLQAFSKANPVTLLADAARGLMIGGPVAVPAVESLLYAAGFVAVFAPLAVRAFRRRT